MKEQLSFHLPRLQNFRNGPLIRLNILREKIRAVKL